MGKYVRYEEEIGFADPNKEKYIPHIDKLTGEQISADNVVVLVVPHYYFVKTKTTEILTIPLIGKGQAYVFREGIGYPATWVRPGETGVLQLYSPDGEPFPLKPGNTWFQVVSLETVLSNNTTEWRFYFSPPPVPEELEQNPINTDGENAPFGWYDDEVPEFSWWPP
jgi:deoxycytidine triphosphate deaminase